jgi:hypothetical protein
MCYAWRKPPNDGDERMKFLAPLAFAGLMAATPAAADLIDMDDAERDAFRAEVRAYLLENPEVLMEAIGVLEQRQAAAEAERDQMGVAPTRTRSSTPPSTGSAAIPTATSCWSSSWITAAASAGARIPRSRI